MTVPLLRTEAVSKTYRMPDHIGRLVLDHLDFALSDGEIVAILGKSGSGKSTFLRILAGLVPPSDGVVEYRGHKVTEPAHGIAMVFQTYALFPWLTVLGNVELGLEALGVSAVDRRRRAVEAIDVIGLDGFETAYPKELSGGMRQRDRDVGPDATGVAAEDQDAVGNFDRLFDIVRDHDDPFGRDAAGFPQIEKIAAQGFRGQHVEL